MRVVKVRNTKQVMESAVGAQKVFLTKEGKEWLGMMKQAKQQSMTIESVRDFIIGKERVNAQSHS